MKKIIFLLALILSFTAMAQEETEKVKVFPNPAIHIVNVLGLVNSPTSHISITDIHGNTVAFHQWEIKNNSVNLPVSKLDPGMYLISIRSSAQNVRVKFLKQ